MKKIHLIIPDLHLRHVVAEKIIKHVDPDFIYFLGDYFDSFEETIEDVQETSHWLKWSFNQPNRIHLAGNHDLGYAYANKYFQCSGYTQYKYFLISDILDHTNWQKMQMYHILDNQWLLSHAGLHKLHLPDQILKLYNQKEVFLKSIQNTLNEEIIKGFRGESWIFKAGHKRGGNQRIGGITWCDFSEFHPIKGLNQIFGHTPDYNVRWINMINDKIIYNTESSFSPNLSEFNNNNNSFNICLDTHTQSYAIWDGNNLKIESISDL